MTPDHAVALMRMEFGDLPGLKLTFWQAQRLWELSNDVCATALNTLIDSHFLVRTGDGVYVRTTMQVAGQHRRRKFVTAS